MIDSQTGTIFTEKKKETGPIQTKEAHKKPKTVLDRTGSS